MEKILNAVQVLASVCDGAHSRDHQGFNGYDAQYAKILLSKTWTDRDSYNAWRMLKKYRKQLASLGINYDDLVPPAQYVQDAVIKPKFHERWGSLLMPMQGRISKEDFSKYVSIHRELGFKFDGETKAWYMKKADLPAYNHDQYVHMMGEIGVHVEEIPEQQQRQPDEQRQPTAREIINGISSKKIRDGYVGIKCVDGKFSIHFPYNTALVDLFSNKTGQLTGITEFNMETRTRDTHELETVLEAIAKIKALLPDWQIVSDGLDEAIAKRQREVDQDRIPIPAVLEQMNPELSLFSFQNEGVRHLIKTDGNALMGYEMGLGKTAITLAWIAANSKRAIVVVPKVVRRTWVNEAIKFFPTYFSGQTVELRASDIKKKGMPDLSSVRLASVNYESFEKYLPAIQAAMFDTIVIDECFHPDTLVLTKQGEKKICEITTKDEVLNCLGWQKVKAIIPRQVAGRIQLRYNGRTIVCSFNHPFFTSKGWISAKNLNKGDLLVSSEKAMSIMQEGIRKRNISKYQTSLSNLFSELWNEIESQDRNISEVYKRRESYVFARNKRKSFSDFEADGTQTIDKERQWNRTDGNGKSFMEGIRSRLEMELHCSNKNETFKNWFSNSLQNRPRFARIKNCNRSRWLYSFFKKRSRPQEGSVSDFIRLDSIEIYESTSEGRIGQSMFYDLEIEGHPSFTVNGVLVHNSHRMKSPRAKITKTLMALRELFRHHILLSGTAVKNKKEELLTQTNFIQPGLFSKHELQMGTIGGCWNKLRSTIYIARQKKDVLPDLPEKTSQIVELEVAGMPSMPEEIGEISTTRVKAALAKSQATVDFVQEILDSSDSNVLVFSESREAAEKMAEMLGDVAILHHGQMSDDKREAAKAEFQMETSSKRVFVSTRQSLAVGATLTRADKVVFNDLPWTAADIRQAEDRCHRIGQLNCVNVYWMTARDNEWDRNVTDIIRRKYSLAKKINEGKQLTKEEQEWLSQPISLEEIKKQVVI